ncbi:MAG: DUF6231 family protein [Pseudomonadales bacterium]
MKPKTSANKPPVQRVGASTGPGAALLQRLVAGKGSKPARIALLEMTDELRLGDCATGLRGSGIEYASGEPSALRDQLSGRYEHCICSINAAQFDARESRELLAVIKNLYCAKIDLLMCDRDKKQLDTDVEKALFSIAFKHVETHVLGQLTVFWYRYELEHYNHKRNWNSPENWANPENFFRYRW